MNQPENIPHCRFHGDAYDAIYREAQHEASKAQSINGSSVNVSFRIKLPFQVSANDLMIIRILDVAAEIGSTTLYQGSATFNRDTNVKIPFRGEWPDGGWLKFTLYIPDSKASCHWGGEELLLLKGPDYPRHFNIELLPDVYVDETGGRRRTIITPVR